MPVVSCCCRYRNHEKKHMQVFDINRRQPWKTGPKELWTTWPLATRAGAMAGYWRKALHASTSSKCPRFCHHPMSLPNKNNKTSIKALNILTSSEVLRKHSDHLKRFQVTEWQRSADVSFGCLSIRLQPWPYRVSRFKEPRKFEPHAAKKQEDFCAKFHEWSSTKVKQGHKRCLLSNSQKGLVHLPKISTEKNPCFHPSYCKGWSTHSLPSHRLGMP